MPHDYVRHRPSARWWIEVVAMGLLTYSYIVFALFGNTDVREDSRMYRAYNLLVGIMYVMKIVGRGRASDNHRGGYLPSSFSSFVVVLSFSCTCT